MEKYEMESEEIGMPNSLIFFKLPLVLKGKYEILNGEKEQLGTIDYGEGLTTSDMDLLDMEGKIQVHGYPPPVDPSKKIQFVEKSWYLTDGEGSQLGKIKRRQPLFGEKYDYDAGDRGFYTIVCKPYSKNYRIINSGGIEVVQYRDVESAFKVTRVYKVQLNNIHTEPISVYEIVGMIIGVHLLRAHNR
ncbi:hypothetical protein [Evansella tamaricis]|uniref:Peptidase S24/S26A/S26B/S26C domain-containing protein n=1 Tax=Evansella tamaricis TaxID=2069301 RepID=A0ABS6JCS6_9BACI|nr:hypothetical protein [Evansella tamaricis]MBU9710662.1 hypothetical protein [Evansella tamaricis]